MREYFHAHRAAPMIAAIIACLALALAIPSMAFGAGTGDDPTPTADILSPHEAAKKARLEQDGTPSKTRGELAPMITDAPYRYLYTPSHKQATGYWCGPATCQVIDDYHGAYVSQTTYARAMGTSSAGTDFTRVDDCLRTYTAKPYYYYGGLTDNVFLSRVSDSILNHSMPLAADLKILASVWPNYNYNHDGHIVPIEGFDWRFGVIRLNDVFNEADYYGGGGSTFGHMTYDWPVVWNGVYNHFRRAVVSAP